MRYKVEIVVTLDKDYFVDAYSEKDARDKALDLAEEDYPDAQFEFWNVGEQS